jgi:hypothetical protein
MGVLSKDLEKMRAAIKTHRNMMDYHVKFLQSSFADDATDAHLLCEAAVNQLADPESNFALPVFPPDESRVSPATWKSWNATYREPTILADSERTVYCLIY